MASKSIAIIGGGIGGLASAIFLSRIGYKVTVFEKAKSAGPVGAGFLLQPPGQMVLNKLGVLEEVSKYAVPIMGLRSETKNGYKILDLKYDDLKGKPRHGLGIQRSTIYQALYELASNSDQVRFEWDSEVEACEAEAGHATVNVNGEQHQFDLCLLCSGSNSSLTDEHFRGRIKNTYEWGCFWTTIDLPTGFSSEMLHQRCQRSEKMMGILPVRKIEGNHEAALYWSAKTMRMGNLDEISFKAVKDEICSFWPEASLSIKSLKRSDLISAVYHDVWTPKPFNGRLIALGDASHATSPQLGQGCTMALLDSWLLANFLKGNGNDLHDALEAWWNARKFQLAYVRHLSRFLTPLYQSENDLYSIFRDWIMAPLGRLPFFYNLQLKTLASEMFLETFEE